MSPALSESLKTISPLRLAPSFQKRSPAKTVYLAKEKTSLKYVALRPFVQRYRDLQEFHRIDKQLKCILPDIVQSDDGRLLFVKNSKAACTTVTNVIYEYSKGKVCSDAVHSQTDDFVHGFNHWRSHLNALFNDHTLKATMVRHPEDRFLSAFRNFFIDLTNKSVDLHLQHIKKFGFDQNQSVSDNLDAFLSYVELSFSEDRLLTDKHFRLQVHNIAFGWIDYDVIGRVENIRNDLMNLFGRLGVKNFIESKAGLHHYNASSSMKIELSNRQRLRVEALYADDYTAFAYQRRSVQSR